jgi:hypothetical protein
MIATWSISTRSRPTGYTENQVAIAGMTQEALLQLIRAQAPELGSVRFEQTYTEVLKPDSNVRVHFAFRAEDSGSAPVTLRRGSVLLVSADQGSTWSASDLKLQTPQIQFREGLNVKAGADRP